MAALGDWWPYGSLIAPHAAHIRARYADRPTIFLLMMNYSLNDYYVSHVLCSHIFFSSIVPRPHRLIHHSRQVDDVFARDFAQSHDCRSDLHRAYCKKNLGLHTLGRKPAAGENFFLSCTLLLVRFSELK